MCNWFQNKSPTHTFAVDWDTWHGNWAAPCYFNGASPTGSARWGYCLQRHLACEGLYTREQRIYITYHNDVIMSATTSQITSLTMITIVYSSVHSGTDERKHQSSASLAFVRGIHRWPVNSPHKGPVMPAENDSIWWRHHEPDLSPSYFKHN